MKFLSQEDAREEFAYSRMDNLRENTNRVVFLVIMIVSLLTMMFGTAAIGYIKSNTLSLFVLPLVFVGALFPLMILLWRQWNGTAYPNFNMRKYYWATRKSTFPLVAFMEDDEDRQRWGEALAQAGDSVYGVRIDYGVNANLRLALFRNADDAMLFKLSL